MLLIFFFQDVRIIDKLFGIRLNTGLLTIDSRPHRIQTSRSWRWWVAARLAQLDDSLEEAAADCLAGDGRPSEGDIATHRTRGRPAERFWRRPFRSTMW